MLKWVTFFMALAASLWRAEDAGAGCLSNTGCDTAVAASAVVSPDLGCLEITFDENECTCDNTMTVMNWCSEPLDAIGFTWCEDDYFEDCPVSILPGEKQELYLPRPGAEALGEQTVALPVAMGESEHALQVSYEMIYVETGCSVGGGEPSGLFWVAIPLLFLAVRGRRRRYSTVTCRR